MTRERMDSESAMKQVIRECDEGERLAPGAYTMKDHIRDLQELREMDRIELAALRAQLATAQAELARVTKKVEDAEKIRDFAVDLVNRAKAALEREGWEGGESLEEWRIAARVLLEKFDPKMLASGLCSFEQHLERHRETVRRVTAERDGARAMMFRYAMSLSGRFWRCLKCKHITHSHTCVHPCKCGNRPSAGYFTSATFDEWNGQNPGRQDEWIALAHQAASLEDPTPEGKP